ncbi:MAG TPA: hypothetical protein VN622_01595 [Clostridia bacterium]|nr:hypothetical protein [Clostridia bacterium]
MTILYQANLVEALAQAAVFIAVTFLFFQIANHAAERFSHARNLTRSGGGEKKKEKLHTKNICAICRVFTNSEKPLLPRTR